MSMRAGTSLRRRSNSAPGATHTVTYTVTTGAGQTSAPHVDLTPGFADTGTVKVAAPTC